MEVKCRIEEDHFRSTEERDQFKKVQDNLKNKSKFNREAVIRNTMITARGEEDKYEKLDNYIELLGIDAVLERLGSASDGSLEDKLNEHKKEIREEMMNTLNDHQGEIRRFLQKSFTETKDLLYSEMKGVMQTLLMGAYQVPQRPTDIPITVPIPEAPKEPEVPLKKASSALRNMGR
jgi:hypothetical protein